MPIVITIVSSSIYFVLMKPIFTLAEIIDWILILGTRFHSVKATSWVLITYDMGLVWSGDCFNNVINE